MAMTTGICKLVRKVSRRRQSTGSDRSHSFNSGGGLQRQGSRSKNVDVHKKVTILTEKQQWDRLGEVLSLLTPAQQCELSKSDEYERSLLHNLCCHSAPLDLVRTFLALCPDSLRKVDYLDRTALHAAAQEGASVDVVRFLLCADPTLAEYQDVEGKTPIILACDEYGMTTMARGDPSSIDKLENLAGAIRHLATEAGPRSLVLEDVYGKVALDYAVSSRVPSHLVQVVRTVTARVRDRMDFALTLKRQNEMMFETKLARLLNEGSFDTAGLSGKNVKNRLTRGHTVVASGA
uniref:Uncharacterized protein n=1 Tax=Odontella aurita TaxID=265563 RepID=A0A7S4KDW1_9STRA|mmetsp:Transcript_9698/g.29018  ORF Transcript_9698/g.29018 Transcript_9698/m.29018 type:complete len:292 (+) Transcript_9698:177-1052(+)|eukprot:CAMPEP_0113548428 /NCGR_PEP_ID=MMETSP0015_2-20120614/12887_1 /TAXON_ID=2838 /ORGANISM="Odontella" /LENGTH=291 /DNA_ID=CAMNT_0000449055 /DNA_START=162 /DNA_END=1037 /DNA_ORIENTATION=- /assembly_acc=CAM_ASM_000160